MKEYKNIIVILVVVVFAILAIVFAFVNKTKVNVDQDTTEQEEVQDEETVQNTQGEDLDEEEVESLEIYNEMLKDGADLTKEGKYEEAISLLEDALDIYEDVRAYIALYVNYDWLGEKEEAREALNTAVYEFGNLNPMHWKNLAILTAQTTGKFKKVSEVYEDGINRLELAQQVGVLNLYTGYSGYLAGNEYYQEAIDYLVKAQEMNPDKFNLYQLEIETLQENL
jgi:tetratricopeptide (TPR) repeat protein